MGKYVGRGLWHFLGSPAILSSTSKMNFGWHGLDMQHGLWREPEIIAAFASGQCDNVAVRVRSGSYADIGFALDAGARHIMVPMVNTVVEAQAVVYATRYAPLGGRSWGPMSSFTGAPVLNPHEANSRIHLSVMIESAEGLENLEAILGVSGIDSVFVGPVDLAMSMGTDVDSLLKQPDSPLRRIEDTCHRRQIEVAAFAGSIERANALEALGYDWVATYTDTGLLKAGANQALGA